jgi:hypothetical protein
MMNRSVTRIVTRAHKRSYDNPFLLSPGDQVLILKRDLWDDRHEWLWCRNDRGQEGWVPVAYLDIQDSTGSTALAREEYSALELSVSEGEVITTLIEEGGWYWSQNSAGSSGWVPVTCFI